MSNSTVSGYCSWSCMATTSKVHIELQCCSILLELPSHVFLHYFECTCVHNTLHCVLEHPTSWWCVDVCKICKHISTPGTRCLRCFRHLRLCIACICQQQGFDILLLELTHLLLVMPSWPRVMLPHACCL